MKMIKMNTVFMLFVTIVLLSVNANAQYGGEIKLKITYEDKPLVGYTITGSINGHDIGGRGVTDRNGDVTLHTDPLPVPQIDVKGVKQCGNATYEWEASGFVYVSPTTNNNFYHLKLEQVAKQMSDMSGLPIATILESYGLNCSGESTTTSSPTLSSTPTSTTSINKDSQEEDSNETNSTVSNTTTTSIQVDPREAMQNKRDMLVNQISKIDDKIDKFNGKASEEGASTADQNDYLYKVEELEIEKQIKTLELEETDKKLSRSDMRLTKEERNYYKDEQSKLKEAQKQLKEDQKQGVSLVDETEDDELVALSEEEIANMSTFDLKKTKISYNSKISKKKLKLKTQSAVMKQDKIAQVENEIATMENTVLLIEAELEERGK